MTYVLVGETACGVDISHYRERHDLIVTLPGVESRESLFNLRFHEVVLVRGLGFLFQELVVNLSPWNGRSTI